MPELLLGCGSNRSKKISHPDRPGWTDLYTLDMAAEHHPDIIHDLMVLPYPFEANAFDEIHAYDVMEHLGQQGDWVWFFAQWTELWRILRPGASFFGISPSLSSRWLWGDPGHTRAVTPESFHFLAQPNYAEVGTTPMSDYRPWYEADFDLIHTDTRGEQFVYVLQAVKPARISK